MGLDTIYLTDPSLILPLFWCICVSPVGVETVYDHQIVLTVSAREIMGAKEHLNALLETLPDNLISQVRDFAEFLQEKQQLTTKNYTKN